MAHVLKDFLKTCVARYLETAGPNVTLRNYATPFLAEDHRDLPAGAPGTGPVRECPWCYHTRPPASCIQCPSVDKRPARRKVKVDQSADTSSDGGGPPAKADAKPVPDDGNFASVACSLLMQALWATRLARPDLLRAVNHVATKALKWTSTCDSMVHRLLGYTQATLNI